MGDQASVTFAPALKHSEQCIGAQPKLGSADALPMLLIRSGSCQPGLDLGSDDRALRFGIKNSAFDLGRSKANLPTCDVFTALSRNVLPGFDRLRIVQCSDPVSQRTYGDAIAIQHRGLKLPPQARPQVVLGWHYQQVNPPSTRRSTPVQ
jgi:hypothetical protein